MGPKGDTRLRTALNAQTPNSVHPTYPLKEGDMSTPNVTPIDVDR
ncbi:hypothetical protein STENM36S_03534 [Streptomyces tendae]